MTPADLGPDFIPGAPGFDAGLWPVVVGLMVLSFAVGMIAGAAVYRFELRRSSK